MELTNIQDKLSRLKEKSTLEERVLLAAVENILSQEDRRIASIENRIKNDAVIAENTFRFDLLQTQNIYHIDTIKKICIDYRLRFLDVKYFKGEIPKTALAKISKLERDHDIELKGCKIMAPSKLFKLEDKDDPLLFAPIGNGYFYLIHKWGNDLHPFRKALVWPFKSLPNLIILTMLMSYVATLMVPNGLFSKTSSTAEFWMVYFFMFKCIAAVVLYYGFAMGKNFNHAIWKSKYFNA